MGSTSNEQWVEPSAEEVRRQQGTRLSERAPWETYAEEMDEKLDPKLAEAVAEYAEKRHDAPSSNQNKEALAEQQELSAEAAKQYQWLTPEEYEDLGPRIGRVMSHAEFITKLRDAGVECWYVQHVHTDKAVLLVSQKGADREVGCWVQIGLMPELSIMNFDDHGVPLAERRRGWRTALLQLILKGILSEETANKVFGTPREHPAFHRYNQTLQAYRNAGGSLG
jgi:hypothetical protein